MWEWRRFSSLVCAASYLARTMYDKKDKKWDTCIREDKYEHVVLHDRFENDDDAKAAGDAWLAKYANPV